MAESFTQTGDIQAASLRQSLDWLGETFTITNQLATSYDTAATDATTDDSTITVKGIFDNKYTRGGGGTDVRLEEKAIVISTKDTSGNDLSFTPSVGDIVTASTIENSIRFVEELRGPQGVTTFYRLTLEQS